MATTHFVLASCDTKAADNYAMPVAKSVPKAKSAVTPTGTSAQVSISATASKRTDVWIITTDTTVWVKFGSSPTAAAGNDWLVMAGTRLDVGVSVDGETPAVITG